MSNTHSSRPVYTPLPSTDPDARAWRAADLRGETQRLTFDMPPAALAEIRAALDFARANGLTSATIEQEDIRIPNLARAVGDLRARLDTGRGLVVLRGLDAVVDDEAEAEIVAWGVCNYFGRPMRQGISSDRRMFTVSDAGAANTDPTRIGASARQSRKHSDNGCLEPRPPCYLGLYCFRAADNGGQSTAITARTIFETVAQERPDILPILFETYHFRAPQAHVWPSRGPTVRKPIFEIARGELQIHYARVMIEPGMEMAGAPLSPAQREALDYLDDVIERPELCWRHLLRPGELLLLNNVAMLHGREAFTPGVAGGRVLKRIWMQRRHVGAGVDPAALDLEELVPEAAA